MAMDIHIYVLWKLQTTLNPFRYNFLFFFLCILHAIEWTGKQRRLKQAKEEAQEEIEKYRQERDRQFKEFEAKVINN